jgi:hypothetical protein
MDDVSLTELSYQRIERIEGSKRRLWIVVIGCSIFASLGLALNAAAYLYVSHLKGSESLYVPLIAIATISCIIFIAFGARKYTTLANIDSRLKQLELLEDTIYSEVMQSRKD